MEEYVGKDMPHLLEPFDAAPLMLPQRFVFPSGPPFQLLVDVAEESVHLRPIERPVIIPPTAYRRIALLCGFVREGR